jgi:GTPase KRas
MRAQYMKTGEIFLLVYSITSRHSFEEIQTFQRQILGLKDKRAFWDFKQGTYVEKENHSPMIIVGNKCELEAERQVSKKKGRRWLAPLVVRLSRLHQARG